MIDLDIANICLNEFEYWIVFYCITLFMTDYYFMFTFFSEICKE